MNKKRIKISNNRSDICKYIVGDIVIVVFNKYGTHSFIGKIEEISENCHGLPGIWISVLPIREYNSDETARKMIQDKIRCIVPIKDIRELPN